MSAPLLQAFPSLWRASDLAGAATPVCPSGFAELDAELPGGGWPGGQLSELLQPEAGWREWRLLLPCLGRLAQQGLVLLVGPPMAPHLAALACQGLAPQSLVWVQADSPAERLWAAEQALRCHELSALLVWLPQALPPQGLRRLQLAAQAGCQPSPPCVWAMRPWAARLQASPAPLRLGLAGGPADALALRLFKRRGRVLERELHLAAARPPALRPLQAPASLSAAALPPQAVPPVFLRTDRHVVDRAAARPLG